MKRILTSVMTIGVVMLISGCGGGGSTTSQDYSGNYDISISSTSSHDSNGGECQDAVGILNISNKTVTGKVLTGHGDTFNLSGSISSEGSVEGGFAVADFSVATYGGKIDGSSGAGTWKDIYSCQGKWTVAKK